MNIDMLVAHVHVTGLVGSSPKTAICYITATVGCRYSIALLFIVKNRLIVYFAICRIGNGAKYPAVVINHLFVQVGEVNGEWRVVNSEW